MCYGSQLTPGKFFYMPLHFFIIQEGTPRRLMLKTG